MARAKKAKKRVVSEKSCVKRGNIWVKSQKRNPHCRKYNRTRKPSPRKPRQQRSNPSPPQSEPKQKVPRENCPAQEYNKSMNRKELASMCKNGRVVRQAALMLHPDKNSGCSSLATKLFQQIGDVCSKI
jgi:hypothetical protein